MDPKLTAAALLVDALGELAVVDGGGGRRGPDEGVEVSRAVSKQFDRLLSRHFSAVSHGHGDQAAPFPFWDAAHGLVKMDGVLRASVDVRTRVVNVVAWSEAVDRPSRFQTFKQVTARATCAFESFAQASTTDHDGEDAVLLDFLEWFSVYEHLFKRPCTACGCVVRREDMSVPVVVVPGMFLSYHESCYDEERTITNTENL